MKSTTVYGIGILILVAIGGIFLFGDSNSVSAGKITGDVVQGSGEVQEVVIGMKNYNYYPNTVKVNVGQPVRISLDESVYGCFRDFTVREFGIRKYLKSSSDYVEFTPDKTGTFTFACSMGMGTGRLIVE